jgi:hypothetical protein
MSGAVLTPAPGVRPPTASAGTSPAYGPTYPGG